MTSFSFEVTTDLAFIVVADRAELLKLMSHYGERTGEALSDLNAETGDGHIIGLDTGSDGSFRVTLRCYGVDDPEPKLHELRLLCRKRVNTINGDILITSPDNVNDPEERELGFSAKLDPGLFVVALYAPSSQDTGTDLVLEITPVQNAGRPSQSPDSGTFNMLFGFTVFGAIAGLSIYAFGSLIIHGINLFRLEDGLSIGKWYYWTGGGAFISLLFALWSIYVWGAGKPA